MKTQNKAAWLLSTSFVAMTTSAMAQDASAPIDPVCNAQACATAEGPVVQITTRGLRQPVTQGTDVNSTSEALQPDRRVEIGAQTGGQAVAAGRWFVSLPDGGAIWAVEDPAVGQPQLNISAPTRVALGNGTIQGPVRFHIYNNYPAFIDRAEVLI